jgi:hypothetical protein
MNDQEDHRQEQQQMNEKAGDVKHYEGASPYEKQKDGEGEE